MLTHRVARVRVRAGREGETPTADATGEVVAQRDEAFDALIEVGSPHPREPAVAGRAPARDEPAAFVVMQRRDRYTRALCDVAGFNQTASSGIRTVAPRDILVGDRTRLFRLQEID